jgi:SAM-dependent methyltransferase
VTAAHRARRALPEGLKPPLRAIAALVDPLPRAWNRVRGGERVPPRRVRASVGQPSIARYLAEGEIVAAELRALLRATGKPLEGFDAICDLASGPGKVLTALRPASGTRVAAIDVNADAIRWLATRVPGIDARVGTPAPPTSFPSGSFDLIISISLLTHLPETAQDAWLAEVARLLRPDGLGVLTVHGSEAFEGFRAGRRPGITADQLAALRALRSLSEEGFVFLPEARPARRAPGVGPDWGLSFHSKDYIRARWSRHLRVDEIRGAALNFRQDAVLVRRSTAA